MVDAKNIIIGLILMLNKYTCIPIKLYVDIEDEHYGIGNVLLPLLGLIIGFIMFIISLLGYGYNNYFVSILIVLFYFGISKNSIFKDIKSVFNEILVDNKTDEDLNNKVIISIVIVVILYFVLFGLIPKTAILLTPVVGFSSKLLVESIDNKKYKKRIIAFVIPFSIAFLFNYKLISSIAFTFMIVGFSFNVINKRYKPILANEDGFVIESSQILFLIITYILKI